LGDRESGLHKGMPLAHTGGALTEGPASGLLPLHDDPRCCLLFFGVMERREAKAKVRGSAFNDRLSFCATATRARAGPPAPSRPTGLGFHFHPTGETSQPA